MNAGGRGRGVAAALGAAVLFGAGTPIAKLLLDAINPWLLAGLLYLGSGAGLALYRRFKGAPAVRLARTEALALAGAIVSGGVVAPVLLMFGLTHLPAADASLLLNAEGVLTALLAWFAFGENVDRRVAAGMLAIVAGAVVLSWPGDAPGVSGFSTDVVTGFAAAWPALAVLGACLAWAIDNNLTRRVSLADAAWVASVKGLAAGTVNLALASSFAVALPPWPALAGALVVGFFAYGVSLALFVVGLRHLGTARAGAYFSAAPFVGAVLALLMGDPATPRLLAGGALMALGIGLHLAERHSHAHQHEAQEHAHEHAHDEHHAHTHDGESGPAAQRHTHRHRHEALRHNHAHFPDSHHRHRH